jgi:hypothetical protein
MKTRFLFALLYTACFAGIASGQVLDPLTHKTIVNGSVGTIGKGTIQSVFGWNDSDIQSRWAALEIGFDYDRRVSVVVTCQWTTGGPRGTVQTGQALANKQRNGRIIATLATDTKVTGRNRNNTSNGGGNLTGFVLAFSDVQDAGWLYNVGGINYSTTAGPVVGQYWPGCPGNNRATVVSWQGFIEGNHRGLYMINGRAGDPVSSAYLELTSDLDSEFTRVHNALNP